LKGKFQDLTVTTFADKQFERRVENAISNGSVLIIENIAEELEPTLDPVLNRAVTKKGNAVYIKLGENEIP